MLIHDAAAQVLTALPSIPGAPQPATPATFVAYLFFAAFALLGVAVGIGFLWGAVLYFFSAGVPEKRTEGKDRMQRAFLGFAVLISAVYILYTINPDLVRLQEPALLRVTLPVPQPPAQVAPSIGGITGGIGPCTLTEAQWYTSVQWGPPILPPAAPVNLAVNGEGCSATATVTFRIFERRTLGDQLVTTLISPASSAIASWTTPPVTSDAVYYFTVEVSGITIISPDLLVSPSAVVTATGCENPEQGEAPPSACTAPCEGTVPNCRQFILDAARQNSISSALLVAIMVRENPTGNPTAINTNVRPDGTTSRDCGLMQVNSSTLAGSTCNGTGSTDPDTICSFLADPANAGLNISIGACILKAAETAARDAAARYGYPYSLIQHTAAVYNGGTLAVQPSCTCWDDSQEPDSAYCENAPRPVPSFKCAGCSGNVPKWVCAHDWSGTQGCFPNAGFARTRRYAPSAEKGYYHFLNCPAPDNWP